MVLITQGHNGWFMVIPVPRFRCGLGAFESVYFPNAFADDTDKAGVT
jgi:hypothetical protein